MSLMTTRTKRISERTSLSYLLQQGLVPAAGLKLNQMANNNFKSFLKVNEINVLILIGFYKPEDFFFAHLIEHFFAVNVRGSLHVKILKANCGAGFIFIAIEIRNKPQMSNVVNFLQNPDFDENSLQLERNVIISEKLFRDRVDFDRSIYESLECNARSIKKKNDLYRQFAEISDDELKTKTLETFNNCSWIISNGMSSRKFLEEMKSSIPLRNISDFDFAKTIAKKKFILAETDFIFENKLKIGDFLISHLQKKIKQEANTMVRLFATHEVESSLTKTWNMRNIVSYTSFMPQKYANEFIEFIQDQWTDVVFDEADEKSVRKTAKDYLENRSNEESIMELAEFGEIMTLEAMEKINLRNYLADLMSDVKIVSTF